MLGWIGRHTLVMVNEGSHNTLKPIYLVIVIYTKVHYEKTYGAFSKFLKIILFIKIYNFCTLLALWDPYLYQNQILYKKIKKSNS